jgi:hypothetical protein
MINEYTQISSELTSENHPKFLNSADTICKPNESKFYFKNKIHR